MRGGMWKEAWFSFQICISSIIFHFIFWGASVNTTHISLTTNVSIHMRVCVWRHFFKFLCNFCFEKKKKKQKRSGQCENRLRRRRRRASQRMSLLNLTHCSVIIQHFSCFASAQLHTYHNTDSFTCWDISVAIDKLKIII